jgi:hypothetical protein
LLWARLVAGKLRNELLEDAFNGWHYAILTERWDPKRVTIL